MWYLLHGSDEFSLREALAELCTSGDFGYNQETFKGSEATLETLIASSETYPFLSKQRLVVLEGLPEKKRAKRIGGTVSPPGDAGEQEAIQAPENGSGSPPGAARKKGSASKKERATGPDPKAFIAGLAEYLPRLPTTTTLVVLVDETLEATHPLMKTARTCGTVRQFAPPSGQALEHWIIERARKLDCTITPEAIKMLVIYSGPHLRLLVGELEKLAIYAGHGGRIDTATLRLLTPAAKQARIFDLTNALVRYERAQALTILHELLGHGEAPLGLTAFIGSQVRTLVLVKDLNERGLRPQQIAEVAGLNPYVVNKTLTMARRFSLAQLKAAYGAVLGVDTVLKRSRLPAELALDLLMIEFGNEQSSSESKA